MIDKTTLPNAVIETGKGAGRETTKIKIVSLPDGSREYLCAATPECEYQKPNFRSVFGHTSAHTNRKAYTKNLPSALRGIADEVETLLNKRSARGPAPTSDSQWKERALKAEKQLRAVKRLFAAFNKN